MNPSNADLKEVLRSKARIVILVGVDMDAIHAAVEAADRVRRWSFDEEGTLLDSVRNWLERVGDSQHPSRHRDACQQTSEGRWLITTHSPHVVGYFEDPSEVVILRHNPETYEDGEPTGYFGHDGSWSLLLPATGCNALQILTGSWFGLSSTLGPETRKLLDQHLELSRRYDDPRTQPERRALEEKLRGRLDRYAETSIEEFVLAMVAELEADPRFEALTNAQIRAMRQEILGRVRRELTKFEPRFVALHEGVVFGFTESEAEKSRMLLELPRSTWRPYDPKIFPGTSIDEIRLERLRVRDDLQAAMLQGLTNPTTRREELENKLHLLETALVQLYFFLPEPNEGISRNKIPGRGGDGEGIERKPC